MRGWINRYILPVRVLEAYWHDSICCRRGRSMAEDLEKYLEVFWVMDKRTPNFAKCKALSQKSVTCSKELG